MAYFVIIRLMFGKDNRTRIVLIILAVIVAIGLVVVILLIGKPFGEQEGGKKHEMAVAGSDDAALKGSSYQAGRKTEDSGGEVSTRKPEDMSTKDFVKILVKSKKLGEVPEQAGVAEVEGFDYLTLDKDLADKLDEILLVLKTIKKEAEQQGFVVKAQPYILLKGMTEKEDLNRQTEAAIPVIKTKEPKPPLVLKHADMGKVFVGDRIGLEQPEVIIDAVKKAKTKIGEMGFRPSGELWGRIVEPDWFKIDTSKIHVRAVIPSE